MSTRPKINRLNRIISWISNKPGITFQEIDSRLIDYGFNISRRTLLRDIDTIRTELGIEIEYRKAVNGYFIIDENDGQTELFKRNLLNNEISENLKLYSRISKYVFVENTFVDYKENFNLILKAINSQKLIEFNHVSIGNQEAKVFKVVPIALKEYRSRWYLLGQEIKSKQLKTFAIQRISNLKISDKSFNRLNYEQFLDFYKNVIGVSVLDEKPEKIVFEMEKNQALYIIETPIHPSQKTISSKENVKFELEVIPNQELLMTLKMYVGYIKIIEPKWIRTELNKKRI